LLVSTEFVERIRAVGDRRGYSSKLTASENAVKSRRNLILIMKAGSPKRKIGAVEPQSAVRWNDPRRP
jgi:hypothetical protein